MKEIKQKLEKMSTEALKNLFYDFRNNEDEKRNCIIPF